MAEPKKLNPNWRERISEVGKQSFEFEEMLRLDFLKPATEKDKKIVEQAKKRLTKDNEALKIKEEELSKLKDEIQEAQDTEKLIADIRQKRIERSKRIRAERKAIKDSKKIEQQLADKKRRLITPPFLGKRVSGKLNYEDGNARQLKKGKLPVINDIQDLADYLTIDVGKVSWLTYHREVTNVDHYIRFRVPKRSGSERIISAPKTYLKDAQSWINTEILEKIHPEKEATAFRKNKNILDNAQPHSNQRTDERVDLEDIL